MTKEMYYILISSLIIILMIYIFYVEYLKRNRAKLIDTYIFPSKITDTIKSTYPHLTDNEINLVLDGLKEYFYVCNDVGVKMTAMPSKVIGVAWHSFSLLTNEYGDFCNKAFPDYLYYSPAECMKSYSFAQESLQKTWTFACLRENIKPNTPHKIPLLFQLDKDLKISDGFFYSLECNKEGEYCVKNIGFYRSDYAGND
ncbi:hypothetical protein [Arcobacter sp.]|uniref:hypothetical protein n=1 Tax=unclassified Arcobacter TaxID=2593671 RepID=UPI003B00B235